MVEDSSQTALLHRCSKEAWRKICFSPNGVLYAFLIYWNVGDTNVFQMHSGSGTGHENPRVLCRTLERDGRLCARHLVFFRQTLRPGLLVILVVLQVPGCLRQRRETANALVERVLWSCCAWGRSLVAPRCAPTGSLSSETSFAINLTLSFVFCRAEGDPFCARQALGRSCLRSTSLFLLRSISISFLWTT